MDYSPRQVTVDWEHVAALCEVIDQLPAIVVDRRTHAIVDGIHRFEAHRKAGRTKAKVRFFDGNEFEVLALAVRQNISHGKPLTRTERFSAASLLLARNPETSDRCIGEICGLSHSTVARIRKSTNASAPTARVGRDGRRRPLHPEAARRQVQKIMADDPGLSIRQAARTAGVSPSTAHRVATGIQITADPALSSVSAWLERTALNASDVRSFLERTPLGRVYDVADECRRRSRAWADLALALEDRARPR